jgi:glucuronokinase
MTGTERGRGVAFARAALAGNPSDGYGGAVVAFTIGSLQAQAVATASAGSSVTPPNALVEAAVHRFARELEPAAHSSAVQWSTSIPRRVGLGGSSAIVIAVLRALGGLYGVDLERPDLAALALAVEAEDLGIAAGLQDRVAQSYGGLTFMEFGQPPRCEQLEPSLLPPVVVAWRADAAADSGLVHAGLRTRFQDGDPAIRAAIAELAAAARDARTALLAGDFDELARSSDRSFDARQGMMALDPRHVAMVHAARAHGAGANYAGSGGAITAVCGDVKHRKAVIRGLANAGCRTLVPSIGTHPEPEAPTRTETWR